MFANEISGKAIVQEFNTICSHIHKLVPQWPIPSFPQVEIVARRTLAHAVDPYELSDTLVSVYSYINLHLLDSSNSSKA